ncbi:MAG: cation:proton antiporter [Cyanobacteria bacterium J06555_13]
MFNLILLPKLLTLPTVLLTVKPDESTVFSALLLSAIVVFLVGKLSEEIFVRFNLPGVVGQLLGGVTLGVSALHILVFSESADHAVSDHIINVLQWATSADITMVSAAYSNQLTAISESAANLGVIALLFLIGLESDFDELMQVGPQAAVVAVSGVILPFIGGTLGLIYLFDIATLPAVFAGAALTATSIGITAKVLKDLGQLQSRTGQVIIGAAVLDDLLGIIILSVVVSVVKGGSVSLVNLVVLIFSTAAFVGGVVLLRQQLGSAFVWFTRLLKTESALLVSGIVFTLGCAAVANAIHLEAILGAFAAGIILSDTDIKHELTEQFQPLVNVIAPVFFVVIGAKTDLSSLNPNNSESMAGLTIAAFLIVVAILGKAATGYLLPSATTLNRLAVGVGMIPRGEVGLVFAGIGTELGILSESLTVAIVLMVIVTTLIAPLCLRWIFSSSHSIYFDSNKATR